MGLDMYLNAKRWLSSFRDEDKPLRTAINQLLNNPAEVEIPNVAFNVKEVVCEAAYWRKANQIHQWFVDNVQDGVDNCSEYYVSRETLVELRDLCKRLLETRDEEEALEKYPSEHWSFEYHASW